MDGGKKALTLVRKLTLKAILERNLIAEGDRILAGVSGGKDSTVMAWVLSDLKQALKRNFTLEAIHISTDFCSCCQKGALKQNLAGWGLPFQDLPVPVMGRLKPGKTMNCYWCSTQRRTELIRYAVDHGFNKLALGHHLDDIIETFFMNLLQKGTLETMPARLDYRKYPLSLIRPLAYVEEAQIIACAGEKGILRSVCTCPFGLHSGRREMRARIKPLLGEGPGPKRRILRALSGGHWDYLDEGLTAK
ncbi:MAG: tRNA 2-thiocytidine biosynthesis TtcA family protein [Spirochaetales bacterium]|jgi:tRNA 2-thiocytidine biosynthesis protein TtcA|nr:tRNA 2-thiocytidine biosynthesis TtcA family protein [Spirochaetales bacterium]